MARIVFCIAILSTSLLVSAPAAVAQQQVLRDKAGTRLGTIEVRADGTQLARDARGVRLGEYDAKTNITRNAQGQRIGDGNLLSALIVCSKNL